MSTDKNSKKRKSRKTEQVKVQLQQYDKKPYVWLQQSIKFRLFSNEVFKAIHKVAF